MIHALLQSLFVQVTVPVILTQLSGMWMDKRAFARMNRSLDTLSASFDKLFEDVSQRFDDVILRLDRFDVSNRIRRSAREDPPHSEQRYDWIGVGKLLAVQDRG